MWEPNPTVKAPWEQTDALGFPIETKYERLSVPAFWLSVVKKRLPFWFQRGRAFLAQKKPGDEIYFYDYFGFMGALSGSDGWVLVRGQTKVAEITRAVS